MSFDGRNDGPTDGLADNPNLVYHPIPPFQSGAIKRGGV